MPAPCEGTHWAAVTEQESVSCLKAGEGDEFVLSRLTVLKLFLWLRLVSPLCHCPVQLGLLGTCIFYDDCFFCDEYTPFTHSWQTRTSRQEKKRILFVFLFFFNQTSTYSYTYDIWKCIQLQQQCHTPLLSFELDLSHSDMYLTTHHTTFGTLSHVRTNRVRSRHRCLLCWGQAVPETYSWGSGQSK